MEKTKHIFYNISSVSTKLKNNSINLVITSPPYPMIKMWDHLYLKNNNFDNLFEDTHNELDLVWKEMFRVLKPGGIICINIGDATRNINENFQLFSNQTRIISKMIELGFTLLPSIIWVKPTNSPNKFLGSGMYPVNAYVSLGHEHILVFRKQQKREFSIIENKLRKESAFFFNERNIWFSDLWRINGISQNIFDFESRKKTAAFPLEISNRLVQMFSIKNDWILDPFGGTGTTSYSALIFERNSYYFDIDEEFTNFSIKNIDKYIKKYNSILDKRIEDNKNNDNDQYKYFNNNLNFRVKTRQETEIKINKIKAIEKENNEVVVLYD